MKGPCVAGLLALLCATASSQTKFVDVDGHRMRANCAGSGSPTVVFDSGFGDGLGSWDPVFSRIARFTHVVAYDRAGYGQSAPGPEPRSMVQIARELHTLLHELREPGPYVLVGHSMGGGNIRAFAHEFPDEVCGLVFVDPINEAMFSSVSKVDLEQSIVAQDELATRASQGFRGEWKFARAQVLNGSPELHSFGAPPDVPMALLIAGRERPPGWVKAAMDSYGSWIMRATEGRIILSTESTHYIQGDEPDQVVTAVRNVVFPSLRIRLQREIKTGSVTGALALARQLHARYPADGFSENALNSLGYEQLHQKHFGEAVALFKLNVEFFPRSANAYDSLAEGYMNFGDRPRAISYYKRSIELNPGNSNAVETLKKLEGTHHTN